MVASYITILKSSSNFTNVFRGTYGSPRVAASISLPLLMFRQLISAVNSAKNIKNCASRHKSMNFAWKVSMALEVKNHSDPPACPSSWVVYRPERVSRGK